MAIMPALRDQYIARGGKGSQQSKPLPPIQHNPVPTSPAPGYPPIQTTGANTDFGQFLTPEQQNPVTMAPPQASGPASTANGFIPQMQQGMTWGPDSLSGLFDFLAPLLSYNPVGSFGSYLNPTGPTMSNSVSPQGQLPPWSQTIQQIPYFKRDSGLYPGGFGPMYGGFAGGIYQNGTRIG